jgi:hypothetical protein
MPRYKQVEWLFFMSRKQFRADLDIKGVGSRLFYVIQTFINDWFTQDKSTITLKTYLIFCVGKQMFPGI